MSLYLSHRGAFTHQPLKCRAVPCCWNVRRAGTSSVHLWPSLVFTARLALRSAGGFEYFMSQGKLDLSVELCFYCASHSRSLIQTCLSVPLNEQRCSRCQMGENRDDTHIESRVGLRREEAERGDVIPPVSRTLSRSPFGKQNWDFKRKRNCLSDGQRNPVWNERSHTVESVIFLSFFFLLRAGLVAK